MDQAERCAEDGKGNAEACGKAEAGIGGTACGRGGSSRGATPVAVLVAPRGVLVGGGGEQCGRGKCAAGSAGEEEPCNTARSTASTPPGVAPAAAVAPAAEAAAGGGEGGVAATRTHAPAQPAMAGVGMVLMTQNGGVKKFVTSVAPGSSAEQRGVQHGDNLLEVLCVCARAPTLPAAPRGFQMCRCARVRVCRRCARTLRVLISPAARFLRACPWQVDGVAVDGLTQRRGETRSGAARQRHRCCASAPGAWMCRRELQADSPESGARLEREQRVNVGQVAESSKTCVPKPAATSMPRGSEWLRESRSCACSFGRAACLQSWPSCDTGA